MKYRVIKSKVDESFDIVTEDGGVAYVYHNGEHYVTTYFSRRLTDLSNPNKSWWDELTDIGRTNLKDWDKDHQDIEAIIKDALEWLVFPAPLKWEIDETLFSEILKREE